MPGISNSHSIRRITCHTFLKNINADISTDTYRLTVFIAGSLQQPEGWVVDFGDVKVVLKPIIDQLDHNLLNDIPGLENPTAKNISIWLWQHIKPKLPGLSRIELKETPTSGAIYEGGKISL